MCESGPIEGSEKWYSMIFKVKKNCLSCNVEFECYRHENRKFCGSSCSAIYSNSIRVRVKKIKVKKKRIRTYEYKRRTCTLCNINQCDKFKKYCKDCTLNYYNLYRPKCEFKFKPEDFPNLFDLSIIDIYGKYRPKNRGNNLKGVSMDHMYSVREGYLNNVDPEIIKHPMNCELMVHSDNISKHKSSSISLEELKYKIREYESLQPSVRI